MDWLEAHKELFPINVETIENKVLWGMEISTPEMKAVTAWVSSNYKDTGTVVDKRWQCTIPECSNVEVCAHAHLALQVIQEATRKEALSRFSSLVELDQDAYQSLLFNTSEQGPWLSSEKVATAVYEWFWDQVVNKDIMVGQTRWKTVWTQTLMQTFKIDTPSALQIMWKALQNLVNSGVIHLDANILEPAAEAEERFKLDEPSTGHKKFTSGDFGGWYCEHCGKSGDEYQRPLNTPCLP